MRSPAPCWLADSELKGKCAIVTSYAPSVADTKGETTGEGDTDNLIKYGIYAQMLADWFDEPAEKAINKVEPSYIRVEADEVTYNMHIMVRFEVECAVLEGRLAVRDMPEYWNSKYEEYLGITPRTDSEGCLQDVHWSMGSIGYFPTYTMGNLLSYQFWNCLQADLGDTDSMIRSGNFAPILDWLIDKIYSKGSKFPPQELVPQVSGKPMGADDYLARLTAKYRDIYGIV